MPDQKKLEKREEKKEDKVTRMGTAPIGKLMLEFSIPAVAAVVLNSLYNVIDSIFLGQAMGEIGLAATQVAFPIMTIVNAFAILAGNGGNSLAAILLGEGRKDDAERALGNSVTVMIIVSIAAAIYATFWIDPLLILVGATDVTLPYARTFIQIIIYGMMICNISFGVNNFIRTAGAPNLALWTTVVGTVVCIALNYVFVLMFGWGVAGSASATIIGQAVTAIIVLWYFVSPRSSAPFKLRLRNLAIDPKICKRLIELGLAPFGLQAAMAVTQVISNMLLASLGAADPIGVDGALASIGVVSKITGVVFFPALGIAIAAPTHTRLQHGCAQVPARAQDALRRLGGGNGDSDGVLRAHSRISRADYLRVRHRTFAHELCGMGAHRPDGAHSAHFRPSYQFELFSGDGPAAQVGVSFAHTSTHLSAPRVSHYPNAYSKSLSGDDTAHGLLLCIPGCRRSLGPAFGRSHHRRGSQATSSYCGC